MTECILPDPGGVRAGVPVRGRPGGGARRASPRLRVRRRVGPEPRRGGPHGAAETAGEAGRLPGPPPGPPPLPGAGGRPAAGRSEADPLRGSHRECVLLVLQVEITQLCRGPSLWCSGAPLGQPPNTTAEHNFKTLVSQD